MCGRCLPGSDNCSVQFDCGSYRCTKRHTASEESYGEHRRGSSGRARHAPGAGPAPSLDALHADVRLRAGRHPDHRPRRGLLRLRRARQALPRRLSALFCVNIGHGRADIAQAGADQAKELGFFTNWSYAHPPAIELAARIASLAPGDLNRVFFTSGGSEAVESALKLARQYHKLTGKPEQDQGDRARDRLPRDEPRRAVGDRHHRPARSRSSRSPRAAATSRTPTPTACRRGMTEADFAEAIAERIEFEGPDTVGGGDPRAGPERRRLLHAARRLLPARARDLRRVRRAADLRRGDLRLGPPRRVVRRSALRLPARHDHHRQGPDQRVRADGRGDRCPTASPSRS